jgi:hypothetical protein
LSSGHLRGICSFDDITAWARGAPREVLAACGACRGSPCIYFGPHPDTTERIFRALGAHALARTPSGSGPARHRIMATLPNLAISLIHQADYTRIAATIRELKYDTGPLLAILRLKKPIMTSGEDLATPSGSNSYAEETV